MRLKLTHVLACLAVCECDETSNVVVADPVYRCLDGFNFDQNSGLCRAVVTKPAFDGCLEPYVLNDGKCENVTLAPLIETCPSDSIEKINGTCTRLVKAPLALLCPKGYENINDYCEKLIKTEPLLKCKNGDHELAKCDENHILEPIIECPETYELKNDLCTKVELSQPAFECARGYNRHIDPDTSLVSCKKVITKPPNVTCSSGFTLNQFNQCVKYAELPIKLKCPKNFQLDQGSCKHEEIRAPLTSETEELINKFQSNTVNKRSLCSVRADSMFDFDPVCIRSIEISLTCPEQFELVDDLCKRSIYADPIQSCPDGGQPNSEGKCIGMRIESPIHYCNDVTDASLFVENSKCEIVEIVKPSAVCERGIYDKDQNSCVTVSIIDKIKKCPAGLKLNKKGQCQLITSQNIIKSCPTGFTLEDDVCIRKISVEPEFSCLDSFQRKGDECEKVETVSTVFTCSSDLIINNTCVYREVTPTVVLCEQGYRLDASRLVCRNTVESKPSISCANGYEYNKESKKCIHKSYVVPPVIKRHDSIIQHHDPASPEFKTENINDSPNYTLYTQDVPNNTGSTQNQGPVFSINYNVPEVITNYNVPEVNTTEKQPGSTIKYNIPDVPSEYHIPDVLTDYHIPEILTEYHIPEIQTMDHSHHGSDLVTKSAKPSTESIKKILISTVKDQKRDDDPNPKTESINSTIEIPTYATTNATILIKTKNQSYVDHYYTVESIRLPADNPENIFNPPKENNLKNYLEEALKNTKKYKVN